MYLKFFLRNLFLFDHFPPIEIIFLSSAQFKMHFFASSLFIYFLHTLIFHFIPSVLCFSVFLHDYFIESTIFPAFPVFLALTLVFHPSAIHSFSNLPLRYSIVGNLLILSFHICHYFFLLFHFILMPALD